MSTGLASAKALLTPITDDLMYIGAVFAEAPASGRTRSGRTRSWRNVSPRSAARWPRR